LWRGARIQFFDERVERIVVAGNDQRRVELGARVPDQPLDGWSSSLAARSSRARSALSVSSLLTTSRTYPLATARFVVTSWQARCRSCLEAAVASDGDASVW